MNKNLIIIPITIISLLINYSFFAENKIELPKNKCENCQKEGLDEETAIVLSNFAGMVNNFFGILQNPDDNKNVGQNLGGIVNGIGNIIAVAMKNGEQINNYIHSDDFREEILNLIITKSLILE